jgi:fused signal recognition particle receptor
MIRIISFIGALLTLIIIFAGTAYRLNGTEMLAGWFNSQAIHLHAAYALAGIVLLLFGFSVVNRQCRLIAVSTSLAISLLLAIQIILGIKVIAIPDQPLLVTIHLVNGFVIFWLLFGLVLRSKNGVSLKEVRQGPVIFARVCMLFLVGQILLGNWVSVNLAGRACDGFPQCNGDWWPTADYVSGLNLTKGLMTGDATMGLSAQIAIHWLHRVGGILNFVLLMTLMLMATNGKNSKPVRKAGIWLSFLLFIEVGLGVAGFKLGMPNALIIIHNVFAALLMLPIIAISFYRRYQIGSVEKVVVKPVANIEVSVQEVLKPSIRQPIVLEDYQEPSSDTLYRRLKSQLQKTRSGLDNLLTGLNIGHKGLTDELLEDIEANLLMADVGIDVTTKIITRLRLKLNSHQGIDDIALKSALKEELLEILQPCSKPLEITKDNKPFVILVVGVNGAGKTTTIGKLAKRLKVQGFNVMLAAGDTFRAAAVEQLQTWGERNDIQVIAQHTGADSASVIYDGIQSAQSKDIDVLIADTAGRLHTKSNLMEELKKVKRIMAKLDESAPHEVLLVLDAGTGQNALSQAKLFNEAIGLTGLALTKLDGTAKGGVIFALAKQSAIPIRYIGVGEGIDDLQDFNAENFVNALFVND